MRWFVWLFLACKNPAPGPSPTLPPLNPIEPSSERAYVLKMLSSYEDMGCPHLAGIAFDPGPHLVDLAETVEMPPWVSIRAASCVMRYHHNDVADHLVHWVSKPEWGGLARVVIAHLDFLSEPDALTVAESALAGPMEDYARRALSTSKYARVRKAVASSSIP